MSETCANCKFYSSADLQCRRYPPQFEVYSHWSSRDDDSQTVASIATFPETQQDWWCGEWKEHER